MPKRRFVNDRIGAAAARLVMKLKRKTQPCSPAYWPNTLPATASSFLRSSGSRASGAVIKALSSA